MNYMKHMRNENGFTLIELLIVIVVIAILATISTVAYVGITDQARTATINTSVDQWDKAISLRLSKKTPPRTTNVNLNLGAGCLGRSANDFLAEGVFGAGECIAFTDVPGYTSAQVRSEINTFWMTYGGIDYPYQYNESFFNHVNNAFWWDTKTGVFKGVVPTNELVASNGAKMHVRGVFAMIVAPTTPGSTDPPGVILQWAVSSAETSCGKGDVDTVTVSNVFQYIGQSGVTLVKGKLCNYRIDY